MLFAATPRIACFVFVGGGERERSTGSDTRREGERETEREREKEGEGHAIKMEGVIVQPATNQQAVAPPLSHLSRTSLHYVAWRLQASRCPMIKPRTPFHPNDQTKDALLF